MSRPKISEHKIREARGTDMLAVGRMAKAYFEELGLELDARGLDKDIVDPDKEYRGGGIMVVLFEDAPVGMVGLRLIEIGTGEIKRMYLDPEYRGSGLGRELLSSVIELARKLELDRLVLDTMLHLKAANALYESFGVRDIEDYNRNPRAQRFMELWVGD